jgi:hypothetical protein
MNEFDITGAMGALDPYSNRATEHSKKYYEAVRNRIGDPEKIAQNTEFSLEETEKIFQYIFFKEHDLGNVTERFAPNFEMAQSWQRLVDGKDIQPHDITMLKHELYEMQLISEGLTQDQAHRKATDIFNYTKESREYYDRNNGNNKNR